MDWEKYEKAVKLRGEIYSLQQNLEDLKGGYWDKVRIELETGYSDMGMKINRSTVFNKEIGNELHDFIVDTIKKKINDLEKEFEAL
jgi:hypothetical protein